MEVRVSMQVGTLEDLAGIVPGLPAATDLSDVWLAHALASLLVACDVPEAQRRRLVEYGVDEFLPDDLLPSAASDAALRLRHLDASRRSLAFAALALEARLNRVLRRCDPAEWEAVAHLAPAERFRLAPRLLDELDRAAEDAALYDLVTSVFEARDELVDAGGPRGATAPAILSPFSIGRARSMVEASARICCFLSGLAGDDGNDPARAVEAAALALAARVDRLSAATSPSWPHQDWDWIGFPPYLSGS